MPRPRKTDRPVEKNISLPTSTVARVELELFSELEGKVPFGAWQKFLVGLIEQHFARLDRQKALADALKALHDHGDQERAHLAADQLLTDALKAEGYHNVEDLFDDVPKWYA